MRKLECTEMRTVRWMSNATILSAELRGHFGIEGIGEVLHTGIWARSEDRDR